MPDQQPLACALYTRVSTRNQLDPEFGSLEAQRDRLAAYCKSQGFTVYKVYEDAAVSAETTTRPKLQEMLEDIRAGKVNCVVTYKYDRLSRSMKDFCTLLQFFEDYSASSRAC